MRSFSNGRTLVICGGHFSPAYAVIETLHQLYPEWVIYYVGRTTAFEGDDAAALEYSEITRLGCSYVPITTGRLQRNFSFDSLFSLCKIPIGFIQSFSFLFRVRPDAILSFGGYVSVPIGIAGVLFGVPLLVHEQTRVFGLANRFLSFFAAWTCLSWHDTLFVPARARVYYTGNPIRSSILSPKPSSLCDFGNVRLPLLYVTGGSNGSHALNRVVLQILPDLTTHFRVLHQCGTAQNTADFLISESKKLLLPRTIRDNYRVFGHIPSEAIGGILSQCHLVIGRAGANTVSEIRALSVPAILVPLPHSGGGEQYNNAERLRRDGLAVVIPQKDLHGPLLFRTVRAVSSRAQSIRSAFAKRNHAQNCYDAAQRIVELISSSVS